MTKISRKVFGKTLSVVHSFFSYILNLNVIHLPSSLELPLFTDEQSSTNHMMDLYLHTGPSGYAQHSNIREMDFYVPAQPSSTVSKNAFKDNHAKRMMLMVPL